MMQELRVVARAPTCSTCRPTTCALQRSAHWQCARTHLGERLRAGMNYKILLLGSRHYVISRRFAPKQCVGHFFMVLQKQITRFLKGSLSARNIPGNCFCRMKRASPRASPVEGRHEGRAEISA